MNEATLRRLQERMANEGLKDPPTGEQMDDDPATDPTEADRSPQPHTIYTAPTQPVSSVHSPEPANVGAAYARHVQAQQNLLERYSAPSRNASNQNEITELAEQLSNLEAGPSEGSSASSILEELWKCDSCGYDSPLMHRFCGLCGSAKPEDWWCADCHYQNSHYHRFCGMCGNTAADLGYEDLGLDAEDEAAIENAAARLAPDVPRTTIVPPPGSQQWDDDDVLTFADDCSEGLAHRQPQEQHQPQQEEWAAWSCHVCTFLNENPLFMCCEMCGTQRLASQGEELEMPQKMPTPRRQSVESDSSSKKKERRITQLMRQQQMQQFQQEQAGGKLPERGGGKLPEPETDHELALIYAQQERILALYQQQQHQQH